MNILKITVCIYVYRCTCSFYGNKTQSFHVQETVQPLQTATKSVSQQVVLHMKCMYMYMYLTCHLKLLLLNSDNVSITVRYTSYTPFHSYSQAQKGDSTHHHTIIMSVMYMYTGSLSYSIIPGAGGSMCINFCWMLLSSTSVTYMRCAYPV